MRGPHCLFSHSLLHIGTSRGVDGREEAARVWLRMHFDSQDSFATRRQGTAPSLPQKMAVPELYLRLLRMELVSNLYAANDKIKCS